VLGDARLRGQQRVGNFRSIEAAARGLADDAELLEIHAGLASGAYEDWRIVSPQDSTDLRGI
jgi:hypothetical protein